jgi:hypothetical protein
MPGLPTDLLKRCHTVLLQCSEFDNHASLQAVFVGAELTAFRDRLPETGDRHERVIQTVSFLLSRYLKNNLPVFPVFLEVLRDQYDPQDAQYHDLEQLRSDVEGELGAVESIEIPFVIVAMTHDEANELITENVFDNPNVAQVERTRFQAFGKALQEHGIADLLNHYGESREDWQPHTCQQGTVEEIILDTALFFNQRHSERSRRPLVHPRFYSSDFFAEDKDARLEIWNQLSRSGCIMIVDAVSMFHPVLRRILSRSEMGSNERVAILALSPVDSCAIPVNHLIEQEMSSQMQRAFARFSKYLDRLCEFGIGDLRAIQRWLFVTLPEAAAIVQNQRPNPSSRELVREQMGQPLGIDRLIFGQRGEQ